MTAMPSPAGKKFKASRAFSAVTLIVIMLMLGVIGAVTASIVVSSFETSNKYLNSQQAFYAAQAGLEWVNKAVTFVSGSATSASTGRRIRFRVVNNTGADVTVTGLTASWNWPTAPADDTVFYEEIRIDEGAYSDDTVWDYTLAGSVRAGRGENKVFNTGPSVTLVSGTQYRFELRDFRNNQTGATGGNANMSSAIFRAAFTFTPNSKTVGPGTFTISAPAVAATENAVYVSTATADLAERKVQMASIVNFGVSGSGGGLSVGNSPSPDTDGTGNEDMRFELVNNTGSDITITSFTGVWSGERYFDQARFDSTTVFSSSTPRKGSGDLVSFSGFTLDDGDSVTMRLNNFKNVATGGNSSNRTSLQGIPVELTFSDGSVLSFTPT